MGGGSVGLLTVFIACGFFAALVGACVLGLYIVARVRRRREPTVRVISVDPPDSAGA